MLNVLIYFISILLTIFLVVGVHEFGHFLVAKLSGIKVLRFSIGFGKPLYTFHDQSGTEYVIALIPLGGYVKMLDEHEGAVSKNELHLAYNRQPLYKKIAVVIAGPLFNVILAFLLYWLIFMVGFVSAIPLIGKILPNSIAEKAGMKPLQEIVSIDHEPTLSWTTVLIRLLGKIGNNTDIHIETKAFPSNKMVSTIFL